MVTGDHPVTAEAIARNIGLITLPTRRSLARERGLESEDAVARNDPEIGAAVVRGIEISGGTEMVNGKLEVISPMSEEEWTVLVNR
jgi:magnesium-transporting ATPase (P-type)